MNRKHHGRLIDVSVDINTTPDRAWRAWTDPQHIANWFVDRAEGVATPGEVMTWFFDTFNMKLPVPIAEAVPGQTFVVGGPDAIGPHGIPYLMEITISGEGGSTRVRLVNSGFSEDAKFDDEFQGTVSGWHMALATMKQWLERYPNANRAHTLRVQPATYSWAALEPLFHTAAGRTRWLGDLAAASAPVLVDTGREVLVALDDSQSVLGVKAFSMGPQQAVALDLSSWSGHSVEPTAAAMTEALARLVEHLKRPAL